MIDSLKYHGENIWENKVCGLRFLPAKWYTITCKDPELPSGRQRGLKGRSLFISQAPRVLLIEMKEESKSFKQHLCPSGHGR